MKKFNNILNTIIWSFIGVFIGHSIYKIYDYNKKPEFYLMSSDAWFKSILIYGAVAFAVIVICTSIKIIIRRKTNTEK